MTYFIETIPYLWKELSYQIRCLGLTPIHLDLIQGQNGQES